jgi:lysophospholipase L1-like esterase
MLCAGSDAWAASVCEPSLTVAPAQLPAVEKGSRLLFQGDSITDMQRDRRTDHWDLNHILGHSFVFLLSARLGLEMPEAELAFINRGQGGNQVSDLRQRWQADAIEVKPDVLTVLVGINDVWTAMKQTGGGKVALAEYEADYRFILKASRQANPDLRIVLLDPFILPVQSPRPNASEGPELYAARRAETDKCRAVVAKLAKEFDAVHLKTQDVFDAAAQQIAPERLLWDGIHPTPLGHELVARHWLKQVSARWPQ